MALLWEPEFWARLFGIGVLNLLLSGDNALVIALAVRALPPRQRVLGQVWGALGAVALRVIFVAIVTLLLRVPLLQLAGGLLLFWIAVRLVRPETTGASGTRHGSSVWEAVWIIIVADITMSLDNVLAIAAAAKGEMILVIIGIALSLPIVIWGGAPRPPHESLGVDRVGGRRLPRLRRRGDDLRGQARRRLAGGHGTSDEAAGIGRGRRRGRGARLVDVTAAAWRAVGGRVTWRTRRGVAAQ